MTLRAKGRDGYSHQPFKKSGIWVTRPLKERKRRKRQQKVETVFPFSGKFEILKMCRRG